MRRATEELGVDKLFLDISIHALREESDYGAKARSNGASGISIHALREESDATSMFAFGYSFKFQSTLSVRRATERI